MAMDPMDEFEFKPITEGLGFHKKAEKIKADVKSGAGSLVQDRVARSIPEAPPEIFMPSKSSGRDSARDGGREEAGLGASAFGGNKKSSALTDLLVPDRAPANFGDSSSAFSSHRAGASSNSSLSEHLSSKASSLNDLASSLGLTDSPLDSSARPASQSISDLIASLPPSLDFVEDKSSSETRADSRGTGIPKGSAHKGLGATSMDSEPSRPQIFQPLGRDDYGSTLAGLGSSSLSNSAPNSGANSGAGMGLNGSANKNNLKSSSIGAPSLGAAPGSTIGSVLAPTPGTAAAASLGASMSTAMGSATGATIGSAIGAGHAPGTLAGAHAGAVAPGSSYLPTPGSKAVNPPTPAQIAAAASPYRGRLDESYARAFPHAEKKAETETALVRETPIEGLEAISTNMMGGILDGMVSLGLATVFLVSILAITHVNLMNLLRYNDSRVPTLINLGALFLVVNLIYMLITRVFAGSSLGEWAFDLQMGSDDDRKTISYFFKLIWRQVLLSATAFVPFPILSFLLGRDIMRPLSGLQLYRRVD